jgi:DNA replication protein DnaC
MPDGELDADVLEQMRFRDQELRAERARQGESVLPTVASVGPIPALPACPVCEDLLRRRAPFADHDCPALAWVSEQGMRIATAAEIRASNAQLAAQAWRERLSASGIEDVIRLEDRRRLLADQLDETHAMVATRNWLAKATALPYDRNVMVLCGSMGLGKTVAAAWALTRASGLYVSVDEYLRDYERWRRDLAQGDEKSQVLRRYKRAHLVVLDEVGRERNAEAMRDGFYRLIDWRQTRRRELTIMITNLSRKDFVDRLKRGVYDERSYSRLKRDAWVVQLHGEDMRGGSL